RRKSRFRVPSCSLPCILRREDTPAVHFRGLPAACRVSSPGPSRPWQPYPKTSKVGVFVPDDRLAGVFSVPPEDSVVMNRLLTTALIGAAGALALSACS